MMKDLMELLSRNVRSLLSFIALVAVCGLCAITGMLVGFVAESAERNRLVGEFAEHVESLARENENLAVENVQLRQLVVASHAAALRADGRLQGSGFVDAEEKP